MTGHTHRITWPRFLALTTYCFVIIISPQLVQSTLGAACSKLDPDNPNRFWFESDQPEASPPEMGQTSPGPALSEPNPNDLHLHAYDSTVCGQFANFSVWQERESAYNCWSRSFKDLLLARPEQSRNPPDGHLRIVDGIRANEGEFPFYVRLEMYSRGRLATCGGTLIHDNIVVTVAHCLVGAERIIVTLGTNLVSGYGGLRVEADKWCNHFEFDPAKNFTTDLAMVRLRRPVRYVANRIIPACLYSHVRHKNEALCWATGMGFINGQQPATNLMTLPVRRRCSAQDKQPYSSCYVADRVGTTCRGDSGAPVLCYDKCGKTKLTTRAFVVGAISWGPIYNKCLPNQPLYELMVSDFNWMHKSIEYLVVAIRNDYSLPYGYAKCVLTFVPPPPPIEKSQTGLNKLA